MTMVHKYICTLIKKILSVMLIDYSGWWSMMCDGGSDEDSMCAASCYW